MQDSSKPVLRFRWNLGFTAAILLTLGVDIALAYLIYRGLTAIF